MYNMGPVSLFYMWVSSYSNTIYWRDCLFSIEYSWLPCLILVDHVCLALFLGSPLVYLSVLCQFHTVLVTVALYYSLKSGSVMSSALFFFLRISLAIQGLSWFHTNYRGVFSISIKCHWDLDRDCIKSIDGFWWYWYFNNINSSSSWTHDTFPFICVFFDFFHQCLVVFSGENFHLLT